MKRELNPITSSITDSQAREAAREFYLCSDGEPCGMRLHDIDDAYCADCPNKQPDLDAARLDAQLESDVAKHYRREYKGIKLDPYRIAAIYAMQGGPREQIMKKCLRFTDKGQSEQQVVDEIRSALNRWQEMLDEDGNP